MKAVMLTRFILILTLIYLAGACRAERLFAAVREGKSDHLLIAETTPTGTRLTRFDPHSRQIAASETLAAHAFELHVIGRTLVLTDRHQVFVCSASLKGKPDRVWATPRQIMHVCPYLSGYLVLVVDDVNAEHPGNGQTYWFRSAKTRKPQLLSLRRIYNFWDIQSGRYRWRRTPGYRPLYLEQNQNRSLIREALFYLWNVSRRLLPQVARFSAKQAVLTGKVGKIGIGPRLGNRTE